MKCISFIIIESKQQYNWIQLHKLNLLYLVEWAFAFMITAPRSPFHRIFDIRANIELCNLCMEQDEITTDTNRKQSHFSFLICFRCCSLFRCHRFSVVLNCSLTLQSRLFAYTHHTFRVDLFAACFFAVADLLLLDKQLKLLYTNRQIGIANEVQQFK